MDSEERFQLELKEKSNIPIPEARGLLVLSGFHPTSISDLSAVSEFWVRTMNPFLKTIKFAA